MPLTRALVVGAGETSNLLHLPVLSRLQDQGRLELLEICDLRQDRAIAAQRKFGFTQSSGDASTALQNPDVTAVYLFGDARMHHQLGLAALNHGKHLFVEKPIAPSYDQAREMTAAARRNRVIAVGGHNRRFYRALDAVRECGGRAGWRYGEAVFHKPSHGVPAPFGAKSWLTANGIHALDALLYVMGGPPESIMAHAQGESFSALLRWANGAQGVFLCDNEAGERREAYSFHAPGSSCRVDEAGVRIIVGTEIREIVAPILNDGFEAEHTAFLNAIEHGDEPPNSLAVLAPSLKVAELIERGFSGRIDWPVRMPARAASAPGGVDGAILITNPTGMIRASGLPTSRRLATLEDITRSPQPRLDIVAVLLGTGPQQLSEAILDKLPNLRVAGLASLSFDRHRPDLLLERGVSLVSASETHAESVAEFAFGLAILARRRAFASDQVMRQGGWGIALEPSGWRGVLRRAALGLRPTLSRAGLETPLLNLWRKTGSLHGAEIHPAGSVQDLHGAKVGLLGWSANARALASRLLAAGAKVMVFSEHADPEDIRHHAVVPVSLAEALAADIVSLHRGLTPRTRHFLGAAELARLRPGTVVINIARAGLIDPAALLGRLKKGDIFACLDVFDTEPPAAADPLRRLPNVFLTSHIAGSSRDLRIAAVEEALDKIERHLRGDAVHIIDQERLLAMT